MTDLIQKSNETLDKVSLCMIVKDEEKLLPGMLASVRGAWDELVVVDTGSSDRTIEILEGESNLRLIREPWKDDFSFHRNQAQDAATGNWILIIDADERLHKGGVSGILRASTLDRDMWIFSIYSYTGNGSHHSNGSSPRLFRNGLGIRWSGRVHNQLLFDPKEMKVGYSDLLIHHLGYDLPPEEMKVKRDRSYRLMRQSIEEEPGNFAMHHHLAITLMADHRFAEALEEAQLTLGLLNKPKEPAGWTSFVAAYSALRTGQIGLAYELALKWLCEFPWQLDLYYVAALAKARMKDWELVLEHVKGYDETLGELKKGKTPFGFYHFETVDKEGQMRALRVRALAIQNPQAAVEGLL